MRFIEKNVHGGGGKSLGHLNVLSGRKKNLFRCQEILHGVLGIEVLIGASRAFLLQYC
jgi:hypothetical protein